MAFTPAQARVPIAIRNMYIRLNDYAAIDTIVVGPDGEDDHIVQAASQSAQFEIQVEYDNGDVETVAGNLVPHITSAQIAALQGFLAGLRAQAEEQILPQEE